VERSSKALLVAALYLSCAGIAQSEERQHVWSGDWYLTLGGAGFIAPKFEGARRRELQFSPIISVGRGGPEARFVSRNDNVSFSLLDQGAVRAGIAGKLVMPRDEDTSSDLKGLRKIKLGAELGGFVEIYPTDWIRARAELRQGIRSHDGVVADLSADAFTDVLPNLRLSGGPRASFVSAGYNKAYYGVNAAQSAASGLSQFDADGGGLHSLGVGAALTWKATDRISTTSFVEYKRLKGEAADSSLVNERGSKTQLMFGLAATYKFGAVTLD